MNSRKHFRYCNAYWSITLFSAVFSAFPFRESALFWSAPRMATSGKVKFSKHAQSNHHVFSANQFVTDLSDLTLSVGRVRGSL